MGDTKQAWSEVADLFGELGLKLKLHFEEASAGPTMRRSARHSRTCGTRSTMRSTPWATR